MERFLMDFIDGLNGCFSSSTVDQQTTVVTGDRPSSSTAASTAASAPRLGGAEEQILTGDLSSSLSPFDPLRFGVSAAGCPPITAAVPDYQIPSSVLNMQKYEKEERRRCACGALDIKTWGGGHRNA